MSDVPTPIFDVREWDMRRWKQAVVGLAAAGSEEVQLRHRGGANLIIGYRLFYMIQFAKRAGLRVCLITDGLFWIEEADQWLLESGVDEIVLLAAGGHLPEALGERVRALQSRAHQAIILRVGSHPY